jgi:hypothetical protein
MKSPMLSLVVAAGLIGPPGSFSPLPSEPVAGFEMIVEGAVSTAATGGAEFGVAGSDEASVFTITLGGQDGNAAVVFTRIGGERPAAGVYPVEESAVGENGFIAVVVTGTPSHPTGVFHVRRGMLTISSGSGEGLAGRFELSATGFLTDDPEVEDRVIRTRGAFAARPGRRAETLTLNDGGAR